MLAMVTMLLMFVNAAIRNGGTIDLRKFGTLSMMVSSGIS